jgi:transcriptional regulator with XRE-family HTH domain
MATTDLAKRPTVAPATTAGTIDPTALEILMVAKKQPNPTDKYVGARVRMRRMMLGITQQKLGAALKLTFQQVQKYEKGTNRIGASRLQQIAHVLQVPESFFFEGGPGASEKPLKGFSDAPSPNYVADFLATTDGLTLTRAFTSIRDPKLRRRIVELVTAIHEQPK